MFGNQDERKENQPLSGLSDSAEESPSESFSAELCAPVFNRRNALLSGILAALFAGSNSARAADACACLPAPDCNSICTNGGAPRGDGTQACDCNPEPTYVHPVCGVTAGTYNRVTVNPEGHVTVGENVNYVKSINGKTPDAAGNVAVDEYKHPTSGVTAGTYNTVTVNSLGHVTAGSNVAFAKVATSGSYADLTNKPTIPSAYTHPTSGVTAGTYNKVTVNAQGHVTAGSNEATGALAAWPIGSIYISISPTSPADLFGGTWEALNEGRMLIGAGDAYPAGTTGGEATHTLTTSEMPSHTHSGSSSSAGTHSHTRGTMNISGTIGYFRSDGSGTYTSSGAFSKGSDKWGGGYTGNSWCNGTPMTFNASNSWTGSTGGAGSHSHTMSLNNTGGGAAHNNMPPYLSVYMWKRTA